MYTFNLENGFAPLRMLIFEEKCLAALRSYMGINSIDLTGDVFQNKHADDKTL